MWDWFIGILTQALEMLANTFGDWGIAIIVLTIAIRVLLIPLSAKQVKSTVRMQQLQPKIQEIQIRYSADPNRQQEEITKLYAELGYNPLGGCLPMILQMPIFFALFSVLRNITSEASFLNIIPSLSSSASEVIASSGLSAATVYIVLDILFGLLTFVPMILNAAGDPEQMRSTLPMGGMMSLMMVWMGWRLPSGVLLYYVVSSAWGALQQMILTRSIKDEMAAEMAAAAAKEPVQVNVIRKEKKARPRKKA